MPTYNTRPPQPSNYMPPEGWSDKPIGAIYAHYFVDGVSLCGQWKWQGELEPDRKRCNDCVMCLHALVQRLRLQVAQLSETLEVATGAGLEE